MDTITLKINPFQTKNLTYINGEPISRYSELSSITDKTLLQFAGELFESVHKDLNDIYNLEVYGEDFELIFLELLSKQHNECQKVICKKYPMRYTMSQRFHDLYVLIKDALVEEVNFPINFYSNADYTSNSPYLKESDEKNAFLIITDDPDFAKQCISDYEASIIILVDEEDFKNSITYKGNGKYIWEVSTDELEQTVFLISEYFSLLRSIDYLYRNANDMPVYYSQKEKDTIALSIRVTPWLKVVEEPPICLKASEGMVPFVSTYPDNYPVPEYVIESSDTEIVTVKGTHIFGKKEGDAFVSFKSTEDQEEFASMHVHVWIEYQPETFESISLDREHINIYVGQKTELNAAGHPENAVDKTLFWQSSDEQVIKIIPGTNTACVTLYANGIGMAKITCYTADETISACCFVESKSLLMENEKKREEQKAEEQKRAKQERADDIENVKSFAKNLFRRGASMVREVINSDTVAKVNEKFHDVMESPTVAAATEKIQEVIFNATTKEESFEWLFENTEAYKKYCEFENSYEDARAFFLEKTIGSCLSLYTQQKLIPELYANAENFKKYANLGTFSTEMDGGLTLTLAACAHFCSAMYWNFCDFQYLHDKSGKEGTLISEEEFDLVFTKIYKEKNASLHYELTEDEKETIRKIIDELSIIARYDLPYVEKAQYVKKHLVLERICNVMGCEYYEQIREAELKVQQKSKAR